MPIISIIVPVYNTEKYLHRCLDSILEQTFTDWECILVDDGSPDNSGKICDEYAEKDSRFKVIHKENGGVSAARNTAVKKAQGEFVTFVDSDDAIHKDFLKVLYSSVKKYNGDICVSGLLLVNPGEIPPDGILSDEDWAMTAREAIERYGKSGGPEFRGPMAKLVRTSIAKTNPFPEGRRIAEDLATNYRYYNNAKTVVGNASKLYYYYLNNNSATNSRYDPRNVQCLDTLEELLAFFKDENYDDLYAFYKAEYLFELFNQYVNLHTFCSLPETEKTLFDKLRSTAKLDIPENIYSMEAFIEYLKYNDRTDLLNIFIPAFLHLLYRHRNEDRAEKGNNALTDNAAEKFKIMLKKYADKYGISPDNHPEWFNFAFPKTMKIYWNTQGIKNKFKRK